MEQRSVAELAEKLLQGQVRMLAYLGNNGMSQLEPSCDLIDCPLEEALSLGTNGLASVEPAGRGSQHRRIVITDLGQRVIDHWDGENFTAAETYL